MTRANFKECHPVFIWKPNLIGHEQKQLGHGKNAILNLEERTKAIQEEITRMKLKQTDNSDSLSNP